MQQAFYICVFFFFLFTSCGGKLADKQVLEAKAEVVIPEFPQDIPFETGMDREQEVLLSQIARKVEYIPLETRLECLIQKPRGFVQYVGGNYIIPCSQVVYMFDGTGKFIRQIGSHGGGPAEYNNIFSMDADAKNGQLYLQTIRKQNVYTLAGDYVKNLPIPDVDKVAKLNDSLYVAYIHNSTGQRKERLLLLNGKGDTIRTFPNYDFFKVEKNRSFMMMSPNDRYLLRYKDNLCFKDYYNDTLFTVTEKELLPRYILQLGKYHIPVESRWENMNFDWKRFEREASKYLRVNVLETDHYVFMPYIHWTENKKTGLVIYDKDKKTCFRAKDIRIPNDMEGGIPLEPYTSIGDNTLLTLWTPAEIMELAEKDPSILKHDKLKNLKEDDNPVLMIVHLK